MERTASAGLRKLRLCASEFGDGREERKLDCLRLLGRRRFPRAAELLQLHDLLCFLRAYPDDDRILSLVETMLAGFEGRSDLRRHARSLADSGVSGTAIHYPFFWPTAQWLVRRHPDLISIDWRDFDKGEELRERLPLLALYAETPGLDEADLTLRKWIDAMRGPGETDAAFLVRRFAALSMPETARETFYQELGVPMALRAGRGTPSRTHAYHATGPVHFQRRPLQRARPALPQAILARPRAVREVPLAEGERLIDLARGTMVTGQRDLDAFAYGDRRDVRLVDCGDGLQFAVIGLLPERRLLLEATYGFLALKNGVPMGYGVVSALFGSSEVAYNVFEAFRGAEAGVVYGWVLSMVRHLFGSDAFTIFPYQLGDNNAEGLRTGAWWFYQKLGFRARDPETLRLMEAEIRRMKRDPAHRSDLRTLKTLARESVFYFLGRPRDDIIGVLTLSEVGLRVTREVGARFGSQREKGAHAMAREAASLLGLRSSPKLAPGERLAWERWSPLLCCLPGIRRWSPAQKHAALRVIRAKGGRRESEFAFLFDGHAGLRRSIRDLARAGS